MHADCRYYSLPTYITYVHCIPMYLLILNVLYVSLPHFATNLQPNCIWMKLNVLNECTHIRKQIKTKTKRSFKQFIVFHATFSATCTVVAMCLFSGQKYSPKKNETQCLRCLWNLVGPFSRKFFPCFLQRVGEGRTYF